MTYFKGPYSQAGYGRGGMNGAGWWSNLFKWFKPIASKVMEVAKPVLKEGARVIGNEGINTVANITKDAIAGKDFVSSAREHASNASTNLHEKALTALNNAIKGTGRKRKRKQKKNFIIIAPKKHKKVEFNETPDIFDNLKDV
jgi:hypothetical protein